MGEWVLSVTLIEWHRRSVNRKIKQLLARTTLTPVIITIIRKLFTCIALQKCDSLSGNLLNLYYKRKFSSRNQCLYDDRKSRQEISTGRKILWQKLLYSRWASQWVSVCLSVPCFTQRSWKLVVLAPSDWFYGDLMDHLIEKTWPFCYNLPRQHRDQPSGEKQIEIFGIKF